MTLGCGVAHRCESRSHGMSGAGRRKPRSGIGSNGTHISCMNSSFFPIKAIVNLNQKFTRPSHVEHLAHEVMLSVVGETPEHHEKLGRIGRVLDGLIEAKQVINVGQKSSLGLFLNFLILNSLGVYKALQACDQMLLLSFIDARPHSGEITFLAICGISGV